MFTIVFPLFYSNRQGLRSRAVPHTEVLALRHQLLVLQRSNGNRRPRLSLTDRLLWVWLSELWSGWRSALRIVKPETVIAWHRRGFRLYWSWKSGHHPPGRPSMSAEVIALIRKMSQANPRWGAPRIHGDFSSERPREIPLGPVRIAGPFSRVSDSLREVFLSFLKKSEPLTLLLW